MFEHSIFGCEQTLNIGGSTTYSSLDLMYLVLIKHIQTLFLRISNGQEISKKRMGTL